MLWDSFDEGNRYAKLVDQKMIDQWEAAERLLEIDPIAEGINYWVLDSHPEWWQTVKIKSYRIGSGEDVGAFALPVRGKIKPEKRYLNGKRMPTKYWEEGIRIYVPKNIDLIIEINSAEAIAIVSKKVKPEKVIRDQQIRVKNKLVFDYRHITLADGRKIHWQGSDKGKVIEGALSNSNSNQPPNNPFEILKSFKVD